MNTKPKDMIGARFGSWTVVEIDDDVIGRMDLFPENKYTLAYLTRLNRRFNRARLGSATTELLNWNCWPEQRRR